MALPDWVAPVAASLVALLGLVWAIARYSLDRRSHRIAELQDAIAKAAAIQDPAEHLYRSLAYEQMARRFVLDRRGFWALGSLWLWSVAVVSPWVGRDAALALQPYAPLWVSMLLVMLALGLVVILASHFTQELVRSVGWGSSAVHHRVTDLLVAERRLFLERTKDTPEYQEPKAWRAAWQSTDKPRSWRAHGGRKDEAPNKPDANR